MTPVAQAAVELPMAVGLGLVFGLGACTVACLPYLAPVFLSAEGGVRRSWRILLPFSLGRLCGYGALGLTAGVIGRYFGDQVADPALVRAVMGVAAIMVGIALWRRPAAGERGGVSPGEAPLRRVAGPRWGALMPGGLFLLGVGMTLTPCAPLGVVLFSAALIASPWHGLLLGAGFGVGAIVVPALVYGVGVAHLGARLRQELRQHGRAVTRFSGVLLIVTGVGNLLH